MLATGFLLAGEARFGELAVRFAAPCERRLTFTPLAQHRVRQLSEGTADGGKTWSTE